MSRISPLRAVRCSARRSGVGTPSTSSCALRIHYERCACTSSAIAFPRAMRPPRPYRSRNRARCRPGSAADHRAYCVGDGPGAARHAACSAPLSWRSSTTPSRSTVQPRRGPGGAAGDLRLPPLRPRLLGHRVQLHDRRLRRIWEARAAASIGRFIGAHAGDATRSPGRCGARQLSSTSSRRRSTRRARAPVAWKMSLHGVDRRRVTVVVDPAGASTRRSLRGARVAAPSPGIATATRPTALETRSTPPARAATADHRSPEDPAKLTLNPSPTTASAVVPVVLSAGSHGSPVRRSQARRSSCNRSFRRHGRARSRGSRRLPTLLERHRGADRQREPSRAASAAAATVSVLAQVNVAPAITLTVDSLAPLEVSGTISPSKRAATIDLYALGSPRRAPLTSQRTPVCRGASPPGSRHPVRGPIGSWRAPPAIRSTPRDTRPRSLSRCKPAQPRAYGPAGWLVTHPSFWITSEALAGCVPPANGVIVSAGEFPAGLITWSVSSAEALTSESDDLRGPGGARPPRCRGGAPR